MSEKHVIVGAGVAGVTAAVAMRDLGFPGEITLIDLDPELPYERPPLSKVLALPEQGVAVSIMEEARYGELDIRLRRGTGVRRLDVEERAVVLEDGERLPADALLLATGARPRLSDAPGSELPGVQVLRTLADARALGSRLRSRGPMVVVGAGFVGLEVAALASGLGVDVTVVEAAPFPLARVLGAGFAEHILDWHRGRGVRIRTSTTVTEFVGTDSLVAVRLSDGEVLPCTTAVVGIGAVPADRLAVEAGILCDQGILVDEYGRTNVPWIFAAGDVANQPDPDRGIRRGRVEHWDMALRHGAAVAASMVATPTRTTSTPYFWSEQFGHTLQMYGRHDAGDEFVQQDSSEAGPFALWLRDGTPVAVAGIDRARDVRVGKEMIEKRVSVSSGEVRDSRTDFRRLVREGRGPRL
ncbi:FAD-dependent oxidoreductase [Amycolatopsis rhabdoformis]|uniref:FAD-dependent oxidoreductase n=1 Tax=Amycolatopsis rhabdoformis TaxID=1448059 RepID=A0ABZ1IMA2_9PSEU|nr:FAD-dependent oxidoreductase [Amycolatopsis rhabdoformis]WSE34585.1 FAD-dependent oxidoreductase [Amycolatopsis rhabdoformis]